MNPGDFVLWESPIGKTRYLAVVMIVVGPDVNIRLHPTNYTNHMSFWVNMSQVRLL